MFFKFYEYFVIKKIFMFFITKHEKKVYSYKKKELCLYRLQKLIKRNIKTVKVIFDKSYFTVNVTIFTK